MKKPATRMLRKSYESKIAAAVRKAIDIGPDEPVVVHTPQFQRDDGKRVGKAPPIPWEKLATKSAVELRAIGLRSWDEDPDGSMLMLIPGEWYDSIPNGFVVETITGKKTVFKHGKTNDDIRFGVLAFGIRVKR